MGWAVSASQRTQALPPVALDRSIGWTARHGDTRGPVHPLGPRHPVHRHALWRTSGRGRDPRVHRHGGRLARLRPGRKRRRRAQKRTDQTLRTVRDRASLGNDDLPMDLLVERATPAPTPRPPHASRGGSTVLSNQGDTSHPITHREQNPIHITSSQIREKNQEKYNPQKADSVPLNDINKTTNFGQITGIKDTHEPKPTHQTTR